MKPKTPPPAFDEKTAVAVPPYRHAATGRTVAFHQPAAEAGSVHLFGANRAHVATLKATEADALLAAAKAEAASSEAARKDETAANRKQAAEDLRRAQLTQAEREAEDEAAARKPAAPAPAPAMPATR